MKLPEKVRLAIDVIRILRRVTDGTPRRVEDLAQTLGTSKNFLHQVVCKLSKAKMVSVIKGPKGGVYSVPNEPSLLDVLQLFGYLDEPIAVKVDSDSIEADIRRFYASYTV